MNGLVLPANIWFTFDPETAAASIAVVDEGGIDDSTISSTRKVRIYLRTPRGDREAYKAIQARMRELFHEKTNYTLGNGTVNAFCVISRRSNAPTLDQDSTTGPWLSEVVYDFQIVE